MNKIIFMVAAVLLSGVITATGSEDWPVPQEFAGLENPVAFTNPNVREGRDLYDRHCKSCHGDPGKYNALALVPPPPDIASDMMQDHTDGELFYKITSGRGAMPQFETTLSRDEIWKVVTYIRRFDPRNAGRLTEEELLRGRIYALVGNNNTTLDIVAEIQNKDASFSKLPNTNVFVYARKAFGNMLTGSVTTDAEGRASFRIPGDMRAQSDGKVDFVLRLGDDFEPVIFSVSGVQVREPDPYVAPPRVLWSTNDRTQIWLLFTYFAALIGAWTVIGYVAMQIVKIVKASGTNSEK